MNIQSYKKQLAIILNVNPNNISVNFRELSNIKEYPIEQLEDIIDVSKHLYGGLQFIVHIDNKFIAGFQLKQFPGCCAFVISTQACTTHLYRKKGIGSILNLLRIDIARTLGYSSLICTDIESNIAQRKILAKNGWKDIHSVVNKRTNNNVFISVINL